MLGYKGLQELLQARESQEHKVFREQWGLGFRECKDQWEPAPKVCKDQEGLEYREYRDL
jgi:ribosomal protein L7/L12